MCLDYIGIFFIILRLVTHYNVLDIETVTNITLHIQYQGNICCTGVTTSTNISLVLAHCTVNGMLA